MPVGLCPGSLVPLMGNKFDSQKLMQLLTVALPVTALDQATKALVMAFLEKYRTVPVIPGFFNLTHIYNPGGAFGFLASQGTAVRNIFFFAVSWLAILLVLYFFWRTPRSHRMLSTAFAMILGGAMGNMIDRIRLGHVVDFLDFYIGRHHWPSFNVADSAITVGMVIFVWHLLFRKIPD